MSGKGVRKMPNDADRLRAAYRAYWKAWSAWRRECDRLRQEAWEAWLRKPVCRYVEPRFKPFPSPPPEFQTLECGAKTRAGTMCKKRDLYTSGRCKFHGGMSTGPTSVEGKARSSRNAVKQREPDRQD